VDVARPVFAPNVVAAILASIVVVATVALDHRRILSSRHENRRGLRVVYNSRIESGVGHVMIRTLAAQAMRQQASPLSYTRFLL
jgi:hypothetical protein